jgi:hypothetical protein
MKIYLYVKTHCNTGLKYLGMTTKTDPHAYTGSGKMWRKHLKENGCSYTTEILFESTSKEEIKKKGKYYSKLWNVVKNEQWANLKIESGDGGWSPRDGIEPWNKGRPMDEDQKQKISRTKKNQYLGSNNPFYGKHHTDKVKEHLSQANKGRIFDPEIVKLRNEKQKGIKKPTVSEKLKGKPKTEEHKEKIRLALANKKLKY